MMELRETINPVAAYAELPRGVRFDDQKPDEQVKLLLRAHAITNLHWMILLFLATLLPIFWYGIDWSTIAGFEVLGRLPDALQNTMTLVWYGGVLAFGLETFFIWYYSVYLTTNYRVVDTDFNGLLHYSSTEAAMHQIQDVTHRQNGIWQLLFNYGDVQIQTAGERENIVFEKVPKPARVADILTDLLPRPTDYMYPDSVPEEDRKTLDRRGLYAGKGMELTDEPPTSSGQAGNGTYLVKAGKARGDV